MGPGLFHLVRSRPTFLWPSFSIVLSSCQAFESKDALHTAVTASQLYHIQSLVGYMAFPGNDHAFFLQQKLDKCSSRRQLKSTE